MTDLVPIRRALVSVSDKSGLEPLVRALAARGVDIVSTGGTAKFLGSLGVPATPVESITGFPEMMDGRLKTLHPRVHGGLLGVRDNPAHARAMQEHQIPPIDLVVINLYPFEQTIAQPGATEAQCVEQIDIGGPAMVRSAAKNHRFVAVLTDPHQYPRLLQELDHYNGATTLALRRQFAGAAYARTAAYDSAIAAWFGGREVENHAAFAEVFRVAYPKATDLRYGENPHQSAAVYRDPAWRSAPGSTSIVGATQLHGKELSYNNLNDGAAALALVDDLSAAFPAGATACVVKHANPCGAATGADVSAAVAAALEGDPVAAYGGILACNAPIDAPGAQRLAQPGTFLEVIIAPAFTPEALGILRERSANVRLLATGVGPGRLGATNGAGNGPHASSTSRVTFRSINGGALVQEVDRAVPDAAAWEQRTGNPPPAGELDCAKLAWVCVKHLASNAVAIAGRCSDHAGAIMLVGAGAGQMDRVTSCRLAVEKAGGRARGASAASDAFFPFPDGPGVLIDAGVTVIVHTGGSKRDHETFELCERRGVSCFTTGVRHFRH